VAHFFGHHTYFLVAHDMEIFEEHDVQVLQCSVKTLFRWGTCFNYVVQNILRNIMLWKSVNF